MGIFLLLVAASGYFVLLRKSVFFDTICVLSNIYVIILQLTVHLILQGTHLQEQVHTAVFLISSLAIFSSVVCVLMIFCKSYSDEDKIYVDERTEIIGVGNESISELYFSSEVYKI